MVRLAGMTLLSAGLSSGIIALVLQRGAAHDARADELAAPKSLSFSDAARQSLQRGSEKPRRGGTLVQHISAEYGTLNNLLRSTALEESMCRNFLFPPLLDLDPDSLELVPMLAAERPKVSDDHLHYTWKLRPGVKWHRGNPDGTPVEVTTADVEFSWKMLSDPAVPALGARGALSGFENVRVVDKYTFVVDVKAPYFKAELEFAMSFRLMPAHLCVHDPAKFAEDPLGRKPVGYGPFRFAAWREKEYLELERNPDWFAADRLPYPIERLRIRFVPDVSQAPDLFANGDVSIATVNDVNRWEEMKKDAKWQELATFHEYYLTQCIYILWNCEHFAFKDPRVRRAMTMLYPRDQVRDSKYLGHAFVLSGPWPAGAPELDPTVAPLPNDLEQAKKLLADAGFADHDGDGLLDRDGKQFRFELSISKTVPPALAAGNNWFQDRLRKAGIEMTFKVMDGASFFRVEAPQHKFDAIQQSWIGDPRDDDLYERLHSAAIANGRNYASYRSDELDSLITAWRGEFDPAKRLELAHKMHRRLAEDQPFTFLFNPQSLVLVTTKLRDVKMHRLGARWHDWWFAAL